MPRTSEAGNGHETAGKRVSIHTNLRVDAIMKERIIPAVILGAAVITMALIFSLVGGDDGYTKAVKGIHYELASINGAVCRLARDDLPGFGGQVQKIVLTYRNGEKETLVPGPGRRPLYVLMAREHLVIHFPEVGEPVFLAKKQSLVPFSAAKRTP